MAMTTAAAVALGNMRLLELPNGGSISLSLLPILALAVRRGAQPAAVAGAASGLVHVATGGVVVHPVQLLLDYGLGAMAPAVAAIAHRRRQLLPLGVVCASVVQYLCYVVSGAVFFAAAGSGAWTFSAVYNATIVLPELIIALIAVPVLVNALDRADPPRRTSTGSVPHWRRSFPHAIAAPEPIRVPPVAIPKAPTAGGMQRIDVRPPAFSASRGQATSSGTSPFAWQTTPPQRDFGR
jgi:thiamine transporter